MSSFVKPVLFLTTALSPVIGISAHAQVQEPYSGRGRILVTPEGDILHYAPDRREVKIHFDRHGRRVMIDRRGNIIATEMPASNYYPPAPRPRYRDEPYGIDEIPREAWEGEGLDNRQAYGSGYPNDGYPSYRDYDNNAMIEPDQPYAQKPFDEPPSREPTLTLRGKSSSDILALQVFLDREGVSPGTIDGRSGNNLAKAVEAYNKMPGKNLDPQDTKGVIDRLNASGVTPLIDYTITAADAAGPFVAAIPQDYGHKAKMTHLGFTSTTEMLAERFHMDETYLKSLNKGVNFTIPGTMIKVANVGAEKTGQVARIAADKGLKQVLAYDSAGNLVAAYPASIGSSDTPSPSGTVSVERIAFNPGYTYNPKINFQQGQNTKVLDIPPGPNGPVGTVWMALSKPTYGIHGTPDPSKIGRTQSHGCIRLTNWDATELAKMTSSGVTVEFVD